MDIILTEEIGKLIAIAILALPPLWVIFKKAGFNPWLSLMAVIPPAGVGIIIIALFLGFKSWPNNSGAQ